MTSFFLLPEWELKTNPKDFRKSTLGWFPRGEAHKPQRFAKSFSLMMELFFYQNINFIPDLPNKLIQSNSMWLVTTKESDQSYNISKPTHLSTSAFKVVTFEDYTVLPKMLPCLKHFWNSSFRVALGISGTFFKTPYGWQIFILPGKVAFLKRAASYSEPSLVNITRLTFLVNKVWL